VAAWHTGCRISTAEEEGRGPPLRRIRARGWGGESGRGTASGRCALGRADVNATMLASGGRLHCARVGEERRVREERCSASEKGDASKKRGASGTGAARRGGGDDDGGREARR
jgi:hypothetical protein